MVRKFQIYLICSLEQAPEHLMLHVLRLEVFAFLRAGAIGGNAIVSPSGGK